jgi:hypothetical protein
VSEEAAKPKRDNRDVDQIIKQAVKDSTPAGPLPIERWAELYGIVEAITRLKAKRRSISGSAAFAPESQKVAVAEASKSQSAILTRAISVLTSRLVGKVADWGTFGPPNALFLKPDSGEDTIESDKD